MKKKTLLLGASVFIGILLFHLIAFKLISGRIPIAYVAKIVVDFAVGFGLSIPIYWLFFRKLSHAPWWKKLLSYIAVFFLYLFAWYYLQYLILAGTGIIPQPYMDATKYWDYYFAGLYYIIIFGAYHAYFYFKEKQRLKAREQELLLLTKTSEINVLKAQIRPHFLFNTLNTIVASVPPESKKTRTLITYLADSFRYAMKASMQESVLLSEELDFIQALLALEQERFGARLQYAIEADQDCASIMINPLLIQPLVENAIEHGIAPSEQGGIVDVKVKMIAGNVQVSVSNTGMVFPHALDHLLKTDGLGLSNLRDRLKTLYQTDLHIKRNSPGGLVFTYIIAGDLLHEHDRSVKKV
jgi:two-component system LytT family sensor kinase